MINQTIIKQRYRRVLLVRTVLLHSAAITRATERTEKYTSSLPQCPPSRTHSGYVTHSFPKDCLTSLELHQHREEPSGVWQTTDWQQIGYQLCCQLSGLLLSIRVLFVLCVHTAYSTSYCSTLCGVAPFQQHNTATR